MDSFSQLAEGKIDFEGQRLAEQMSRIYLIAVTAISFIVGFVLQSLQTTFILYGVSVFVLALIVVPPWPMFNRHAVTWLPPTPEGSKKTS
ncbi:microsomal signal peptidase 12kDa subunit [Desarmillaria tabescens]|uniref:Signal peptidase complex subunit 1 n=1 Tax=Armillaria tabescens TaxID=1929756 RepID=A0AA39K3Y8_ARMTA|nr:microsomal signal peptidase 12kDa subunit [Desarmillaria tabescens]KAK0452921.1 microsomal signal peptidase 12kDa subunit [Desarmillaria tabescens]